MPLVKLDPLDAALNIPMYLPLGCLLGLMVLRRSWRNFVALVLVVVSVSLTFELAQLFLASRAPSIDDLIFNTLGGALGIWLGFRLVKHAAQCSASVEPRDKTHRWQAWGQGGS